MIDSYIASLASRDISPATNRTYASAARAFAVWVKADTGAPVDPQEISAPMIVRYRTEMLTRGYAPATINVRLAALEHLLDYAVANGMISDNPARGIKRAKEQQTAPPVMSERNQARLIAAAKRSADPERDAAIVTVLLHAGLRISELCDLLVDDVTINERSGSALVLSGKGNKRRRVPLNATARAALKKWLAERASDPTNDDPRVFRITPRAVNYALARLCHTAKIDNPISAHDLRHTFVYNARRAGISDNMIADIAGHSSLNTTRRYGRATLEDLHSAAELLAWE